MHLQLRQGKKKEEENQHQRCRHKRRGTAWPIPSPIPVLFLRVKRRRRRRVLRKFVPLPLSLPFNTLLFSLSDPGPRTPPKTLPLSSFKILNREKGGGGGGGDGEERPHFRLPLSLFETLLPFLLLLLFSPPPLASPSNSNSRGRSSISLFLLQHPQFPRGEFPRNSHTSYVTKEGLLSSASYHILSRT